MATLSSPDPQIYAEQVRNRALITGALLGASGVGLGAFGAHGLERLVDPHQLDTWDTAVLYQLTHALLLVAMSSIAASLAKSGSHRSLSLFSVSITLLFTGTLLFSGSLYLLVLGGPRWLGPVTPLGGTLLIVGWLLLCWLGIQMPRTQTK